jgi:hypothetical protein
MTRAEGIAVLMCIFILGSFPPGRHLPGI